MTYCIYLFIKHVEAKSFLNVYWTSCNCKPYYSATLVSSDVIFWY